MTPPTPAEQIRRFIERHPGEWRMRFPGDVDGDMVLETTAGWLLLCPHGGRVSVTASRRGPDEPDFCADDDERDAPILTQAAARIADVVQAYGGSADTLPPWLAGPVSHQLINRARTLLTSAGVSPADAVMAAETLDEALCQRAPVAPADVINALQAIGMSCRWIVGADIPEIDYLRGLELNLKATCRQRDALLAAIKQAVADLDAYSETDKGVRIATLPARAALRRVLEVT